MYNERMIQLTDAHNHIKTELPLSTIYNSYRSEQIDFIKTSRKKLINVGLHPKYINEDFTISIFENVVKDYQDINIGEVGLDRRYSGKNRQIDILKGFIDLSIKYDRSITFHCVKCWGEMVKIVRGKMNRDIPHMYHGYSGSIQTMTELLSGASYFSFSRRELGYKRINSIIEAIPTEKLLIESDLSTKQYVEIGENRYIEILENTYRLISIIKKIPMDELIQVVDNNFLNFISTRKL